MSISHKLNLALSMEDDAPNVQVNIDTDEGGMPLDDVVATDDGAFEPTPEADAAEITERAEEIEEDNDDIEDMEVATESLIATYEAMALAQRNGGLTREAATFAAISVESVMSKYNVGHEDVGISLESFDDNKSRATTVSMEGIGQALKDLWEAIVKKFKEMVKKIVDFYQKTIAAAPRIKRRAEGVRKKADKTTGSPEETQVKVGLFPQLNIQGHVPKAGELIAGIQGGRGIYSKNTSKVDMKKELEKMFKPNFNDANVWNSIAEVFNSLKVSKVDKLPGNNAFYSEYNVVSSAGNASDDSNTMSSAVQNFKYGIFEDKSGVKNSKENREKEFPVLKKDEVIKICDEIILSMNDIISFKTQATSGFDTGAFIEKEGSKLIDKIANQGSGENKGKHEGTARRYLTAIASVARKLQAGEASVVRHNYQVSKAALAYCARSLALYKN